MAARLVSQVPVLFQELVQELQLPRLVGRLDARARASRIMELAVRGSTLVLAVGLAVTQPAAA